MAVFKYTVKDWEGKTREGVHEAGSLREVMEYLRTQKYTVLNIKEQATASTSTFMDMVKNLGRKKVKSRDYMVFCRQFSTMIVAGLTVLKSIQIMSQQIENQDFKERLRNVGLSVEKGSTLADAMRMEGSFFPPIIVNMVAAGEAGGILGECFDRLSHHFERAADLEEKVRSAMTYPVVISGVAVLVLCVMIFFVLPTFGRMFEGMGMELPLITRIVMGIGELVIGQWYLVGAVGAGLVFLTRWYLSTKQGKDFMDALKLKLPIFAPIYKKTVVARFSRTLSTLLASGVDILISIELVEKLIGNIVYSRSLSRARQEIRDGQTMATPLRYSGLFPPLLVEMIQVGEETGTLDEMLSRSAEFYEKEVTYVVDRLSSVIEPVVLIFIGIFVGGLVTSLVLPMFQMYEGF